MYPEAHGLFAAALAGKFLWGKPKQAAYLVVGAVFPDTAMVIEGLCRKTPMDGFSAHHWSTATIFYNERSHSFILISLALALAYIASLFVAKVDISFLIGWLTHPVVDLFTHGRKTLGPDYFWPDKTNLGHVLGIADYRRRGTLWPAWGEFAFDALMIGFIVMQFIRHRRDSRT